MAVRKKSVKKTETVNNEVDSLREYTLEAEQVDLLKTQPGWQILQRDLDQYLNEIGSKLPYLNTKSKEYSEARVLYIASDKLLKMVLDYEENRKRALELLEKLDNTKENIVLDVDN